MEIRPFQVVHYPFDRQTLERVVCPPYDKVSDDEIDTLRKKGKENYIWAILGKTLSDHDYHLEAARNLRGWLDSGIMVRDPTESMIGLRQTFTVDGQVKTRVGFFALLRIPEDGEESVLPHERTFSEHKADRLSLYRCVRGNPESIFVLYSDPTQTLRKKLADLQSIVTFEDFYGHQNELMVIDSEEIIGLLKKSIEPQKLLIADGHHRFETARNYRRECRAAHPDKTGPQPWDYILVYLTAMEDPGLVILPTHRLIKKLSQPALSSFLEHTKDFFDIESTPYPLSEKGLEQSLRDLSVRSTDRETIGLATQKEILFLSLRDRKKLLTLLPSEIAPSISGLPVVWLHQILLDQFLGIRREEGAPDQIKYVRTAGEVHQALSDGSYQAAFLLRGTKPNEVKQVAESGNRMPQKSTDFYPKILSGLVAYLYP